MRSCSCMTVLNVFLFYFFKIAQVYSFQRSIINAYLKWINAIICSNKMKNSRNTLHPSCFCCNFLNSQNAFPPLHQNNKQKRNVASNKVNNRSWNKSSHWWGTIHCAVIWNGQQGWIIPPWRRTWPDLCVYATIPILAKSLDRPSAHSIRINPFWVNCCQISDGIDAGPSRLPKSEMEFKHSFDKINHL